MRIGAEFGMEPAALAWEEAHFLIDFRTVDEFRNRATAAKQARIERLRSKGIVVEEVSERPGIPPRRPGFDE